MAIIAERHQNSERYKADHACRNDYQALVTRKDFGDRRWKDASRQLLYRRFEPAWVIGSVSRALRSYRWQIPIRASFSVWRPAALQSGNIKAAAQKLDSADDIPEIRIDDRIGSNADRRINQPDAQPVNIERVYKEARIFAIATFESGDNLSEGRRTVYAGRRTVCAGAKVDTPQGAHASDGRLLHRFQSGETLLGVLAANDVGFARSESG